MRWRAQRASSLSALQAQPAETWRRAAPLAVDSLALDTVSIMSLCLLASTYKAAFPFTEHFYAGDSAKDMSCIFSLYCRNNPMGTYPTWVLFQSVPIAQMDGESHLKCWSTGHGFHSDGYQTCALILYIYILVQLLSE